MVIQEGLGLFGDMDIQAIVPERYRLFIHTYSYFLEESYIVFFFEIPFLNFIAEDAIFIHACYGTVIGFYPVAIIAQHWLIGITPCIVLLVGYEDSLIYMIGLQSFLCCTMDSSSHSYSIFSSFNLKCGKVVFLHLTDSLTFNISHSKGFSQLPVLYWFTKDQSHPGRSFFHA